MIADQAKGKRTIVILNIGGVVETASWNSDPGAILLAWQGGQETGSSIADILSGKANPSWKLAVTFPAKYEDVPSAATSPGKELPSDKPVKELKGFSKTRLLQPGESQTLTFELDSRNLASFDPEVCAWIADAVTYTVKIGTSSKDVKQSGDFELARDITVKSESHVLVPVTKIEELKASSK